MNSRDWGAFFFGPVSFGQAKEMNPLAAAKMKMQLEVTIDSKHHHR